MPSYRTAPMFPSPLAPPMVRYGSRNSSSSQSSSPSRGPTRDRDDNRFSSPSPGGSGYADGEDDLPSDVEKSFGEAMSVCGPETASPECMDISSFGEDGGHGQGHQKMDGIEYPFPGNAIAGGSGLSQRQIEAGGSSPPCSDSPPRRYSPFLSFPASSTKAKQQQQQQHLQPQSQFHSQSQFPGPSKSPAARLGVSENKFNAMSMLASPTSSSDDSQHQLELSPTAQRQRAHITGTAGRRRPGPVPLQANSMSIGMMMGSEGGSSSGEIETLRGSSSLKSRQTTTTSTSSSTTSSAVNSAFSSYTMTSNTSSSSTSSSSSGLMFATRPRGFGRETSRANINTNTSSSTMDRSSSRSFGPAIGSAGLGGDVKGKGLMLPPPVPSIPKAFQNGVDGENNNNNNNSGKRNKPRMPIPSFFMNADEGLDLEDPMTGLGDENRDLSGDGSGAAAKRLFRPTLSRFATDPTFADNQEFMAPSPTQSRRGSRDTESPYKSTSSAAAIPMSKLSQQSRFESPAASKSGSVGSGSPDLGSFFCDSPSAPTNGKMGGLARMKGLMSSGGGEGSSSNQSSPASPIDSPSNIRPPQSRVMDRTASAAVGGLFGGVVAMNGRAASSRRTQPYRRPALGTVASTVDVQRRVGSTISAYPVMELGEGESRAGTLPRGMGVPMRRAFSVCDQGAGNTSGSPSSGEADEMDASPCGPQSRVVSHFEVGSEGPATAIGSSFRTIGRGGGPVVGNENPSGGLLGFGENEMDGKILPCHRVREDGLVRITHDTLRSLIDGHYDDRMQRYHIVDCRFDYEFEGGHVDGALNANSKERVEELLLKAGSGIWSEGGNLPTPSRSGEEGNEKPVVIVFHCEFSNKRAPSLAKHLRSKDRTLNGQHYPKVFYPELYILEGGYCDFYSRCPDKCNPSSYVPMDDPQHFERRDSDLHAFRQFNRTRSFTYGEAQPVIRSQAPCPTLAFTTAAADAIRRSNGAIIHEEEDVHMASPRPQGGLATIDSPGDSSEGSPSIRGGIQPSGAIFGSTRNRILGRPQAIRSGFMRVASYAGTTERR